MNKLTMLYELELQSQNDLSILSMILKSFPCDNCITQSSLFKKILDLIKRMNDSKEFRLQLINDEIESRKHDIH